MALVRQLHDDDVSLDHHHDVSLDHHHDVSLDYNHNQAYHNHHWGDHHHDQAHHYHDNDAPRWRWVHSRILAPSAPLRLLGGLLAR
jgi:hypothetical protein